MTITKNQDGTSTITASDLEIDLIWVATQIAAQDEDTNATNAQRLQEIADQLA